MGPSRDVKLQLLPIANFSGKDISDSRSSKEMSKSAWHNFSPNTRANSPFTQFDTVNSMVAKFLSAVIILITLLFADGKEGPSVIASTPTSLNTASGEIGHFICTLIKNLSSAAEITWKKEGHTLRDGSSGIVIISWHNRTILESHLLVAVTDDDRRGTYTCDMNTKDGQLRKSFLIQGQEAKKLSDVDYTAIGVAIGISLCLSMVILVFLVRGRKRLQEGKLGRMTTVSHSVNWHDNAVVEEGEKTSDGVALNALINHSTSRDSRL